MRRARSKETGPRLRQPVRAPLGYLEQRHALEPVRGAGQSRRPRRRAGEREPARSTPTCPPSPMAATRNSRSAPTAPAWCSARAWPGREEAWSTNFDLYEVPSDGSAAPAEPHRRQSGVGHATRVPAQRRPRMARDEPPRLRSRPLPHQGDARRRGARSRAELGPLGSAPRPSRATAARCSRRRATSGRRRCSPWMSTSGRVTPISGKGYVGDYSRRAERGTVVLWHDLASPPDLYLLTASGERRRLTTANAEILASPHARRRSSSSVSRAGTTRPCTATS